MGEIGRWTNTARAMAGQLRASFDDMAKRGELDELRKEIEALKTVHPFEGARPGVISPATWMNDDEAGTVPAAASRMELVEAATES